MHWNLPETFKEDPSLFPNRLLLLLVEVTEVSTDCIVDAVEGTQYVTMGHWYPGVILTDPGHWEYVGWNWDQDCFVGTHYDKVLGWAELPTTPQQEDNFEEPTVGNRVI